jgi:hypothetical protein
MRSMDEVRTARLLEQVYHNSQDSSWDGRHVLSELLDKHGAIDLPDKKRRALGRLFSVALVGELAAWKVAAALALDLDSVEARMAATAQAHDEARHFYVLHDYLALLGCDPEPLPRAVEGVLNEVLQTRDPVRRVLGLELVIEPVAMTLYALVRKACVEPILGELLGRFEDDAARHLVLGWELVPRLLAEASPARKLRLFVWHARMALRQLDGMVTVADDLRCLGFDPREVVLAGQQRQMQGLQELFRISGGPLLGQEALVNLVEARIQWDFPGPGAFQDLPRRVRRTLDGLAVGPDQRRRETLVSTSG